LLATLLHRDGPLKDRIELSLPDAGDDELRRALIVTVDTPYDVVQFGTTHLNWKPDHGWIRERQVADICDMMAQHTSPDGFPRILAGDFNAVPGSPEISYITTPKLHNSHEYRMVDAWLVAGDRSSGFTWSNRNTYARQANDEDRRLDYIFVGQPLANAIGRVDVCRIVCNDEENGVWPSDHFGVYAELRTEPLH